MLIAIAAPDASLLYALPGEVVRGNFSIPIAKTLPLEQTREAQSDGESSKVSGKVVMQGA